MARSQSKLWRWWGYGLAVGIVLLALNEAAGPVTYLILMALLILYILLQAPATCAAVNRIATRTGEVDFCRNNCSGMLLGCHIRAHKWQKVSQQWWNLSWRQKSKGIWSGAPARLATVTGIIGTITGIFGMVNDLI